jgi:uncharacterized protein
MPIAEIPKYKPPFLYRNRHIHTIIPSFFRKIKAGKYLTRRLATNDNDFIDIDFHSNQNDKVAIITHGLEGNSRKPYMLGIVKTMLGAGFDAIAVNLRGCSGQHNSLLTSYHAGKSDDLAAVIEYITQKFDYKQIVLIGFSLGGNITLKYVGESGNSLPSVIKAAIGISVPCDLASTSKKLSVFSNRLYLLKFLGSLKRKALYKIKAFDVNYITDKDIQKCKSFYQFDDIFTAPVHGFVSAVDYWNKCNSKQFLKNISVPTLLLNALDDPMLSPECYPYDDAQQNPFLFLETPRYGGHVGFATSISLSKIFFHEKRIIDFLKELRIS